MIPPLPVPMRPLCRIAELPDNASMAFAPAPGHFIGLFAVRQGDQVHVYVNACPHIGTPLDWVPGRFLSSDNTRIVCATHGAEFRITDGVCLRGPCQGDRLEPVPCEIKDGVVLIPANAGG